MKTPNFKWKLGGNRDFVPRLLENAVKIEKLGSPYLLRAITTSYLET